VGIFTRNKVSSALDKFTKGAVVPMAIASPWGPGDPLVTWAISEALATQLENADAVMTRDLALRIPGVKRAHGIVCSMFARIPFYVMNDEQREDDQPRWITTSDSGVAPYHRMYGLGSDFFFTGWGCLGFDADKTDCLHIPFGMWNINDDGVPVVTNDAVPEKYRAQLVVIPMGYGENGLLIDGLDTLKEARKIEAAYQDRLDNPIPLTVLDIPFEQWQMWTPDERKDYRDQWVAGRKAGGTATKPAEWGVNFPAESGLDLFESGRNAVRLDIANHTGMPAGLLEGLRQGGGGGSEIRYSSDVGGAHRSELWDFGLPARMVHAFEARMSLDDVVASGLSIRGDLSGEFVAPNPSIDPTSED
jgi:hypothetical protein